VAVALGRRGTIDAVAQDFSNTGLQPGHCTRLNAQLFQRFFGPWPESRLNG